MIHLRMASVQNIPVAIQVCILIITRSLLNCSSSDSSYGCNSGYSSGLGAGTGTGTGGGGFWTGAATGGLLGYLFGSRTNTDYYNRPHYRRSTRDSYWGGWGSTDGGSGWSSSGM